MTITLEVTETKIEPQGMKEAAAMALESLGNVRVTAVVPSGAEEQMKLAGFNRNN